MCHHRFTFADVWMAVYKKGIRIWNIYRRDSQGLQLHDVPPDIFTYVTNIYLTSGDPRRFGEGISAWLWIIINPCMVFPGDGWIIQYVPKYIDASWPNPIPCCLPHESKKPIAAHSYTDSPRNFIAQGFLLPISLPSLWCWYWGNTPPGLSEWIWCTWWWNPSPKWPHIWLMESLHHGKAKMYP